MRVIEKLKEKVVTVKSKVMAGMMTAMAAVMGTGITAFASEPAGDSASLSTVMTTVTELTKGAGDMLNTIVSNPILVVFLAGSVAGVILGLLRRIKRTAG